MDRIKHWKVFNESYLFAKNLEATWFIDPPYQRSGVHYRCGAKDIDFSELATWCRLRLGQVLVCEQAGADWLPFQPFLVAQGAGSQGRKAKSYEMLWTK